MTSICFVWDVWLLLGFYLVLGNDSLRVVFGVGESSLGFCLGELSGCVLVCLSVVLCLLFCGYIWNVC